MYLQHKPIKGIKPLDEEQEVKWAIASSRIYKCENCDAWHYNTEEEASNKWIYN